MRFCDVEHAATAMLVTLRGAFRSMATTAGSVAAQRGPVYQRVHKLLEDGLKPSFLSIVDDSHKHAGHQGAREHPHGESHFHVTVVSDAFEGKTKLQRHQLVYQTLGDVVRNDLHALQMATLTAAEYAAKQKP